jgi:cytochrome c biogenesis protein CcmG/thiol:disulfide interchange protein DsbE
MKAHPVRWTIAVLGALALALLTTATPLPWPWPLSDARAERSDAAEAAAGSPGASAESLAVEGGSCPADAKPANLNFTLKDMTGKDVKLSDFKGKVILLDFWATWCIPCKVEIPWFVEFQKTYGPKGLQVIGVSVDDTLEKLKPYVSALEMNYPVLLGLGRDDVQNAYGPMWGLPVTAIIARDGRICEKHIGMGSKSTFEAMIKSLL